MAAPQPVVGGRRAGGPGAPRGPARQALSADEHATGQAMTREQAVTDALEAPLSEPGAPLHHPPERQRTAAPARRRRSQTQRQECALVHLRTVGALSPRAYADVFGVSIDLNCATGPRGA
jgi:hypothetical protein